MNKLKEEIKKAIESEMARDDSGCPCLYKGGESEDAAEAVALVAMKWIEACSIGFFVWLIRDIKIDVIDAVEAIECPGMQDGDGFVPVLTIKQLHEIWLKENGLSTPTESDKPETPIQREIKRSLNPFEPETEEDKYWKGYMDEREPKDWEMAKFDSTDSPVIGSNGIIKTEGEI